MKIHKTLFKALLLASVSFTAAAIDAPNHTNGGFATDNRFVSNPNVYLETGNLSHTVNEYMAVSDELGALAKGVALSQEGYQYLTNEVKNLKSNSVDTSTLTSKSDFDTFVSNTNQSLDATTDKIKQVVQSVDTNSTWITNNRGMINDNKASIDQNRLDISYVTGVAERNSSDIGILKDQVAAHDQMIKQNAADIRRNTIGIALAAASDIDYPTIPSYGVTYAFGANIANYRDVTALGLGIMAQKTELFGASDAGRIELTVSGSDADGWDDTITTASFGYSFQ